MLPHLLPLLFVGLSMASTLPQEMISQYPDCDCTGDSIQTDPSVFYEYICGDRRLGPRILPRKLPLGTFVSSYDRFGKMGPDAFLKKWWNTTKKDWDYPDIEGFQLDAAGNPINSTMTLEPGMLVDRFGAPGGRFLSPASAPFPQRALHPANLDTPPSWPDFPNNYHAYKVLKPFNVSAGPIRPWFGQPGFGTQFFLGKEMNVQYYLSRDYLTEINPSQLVMKDPSCGFGREDL